MQREQRTRLRPEVSIPIVSMADIALLLLIFFMLTSTFIRETGVDVNLPQAQEADFLPKRDISIEVSKEGAIQLNNRNVTLAELPTELHKELAQTSSKKVTIRADELSRYGTCFSVMAIVRGEGAEMLLAGEVEQ